MARKFTPEWWVSLRPEVAGRETEKIVEAILREENKRIDFVWHRLPDSKQSRGLVQAQPADYMLVDRGVATLLEIKSLRHAYRIPKDRITQLPMLHKFAAAGAVCLVLIHHYMTGVWRVVNADELEAGVPSWDLRGLTEYKSADEALAAAALNKINSNKQKG